MLPSAKLAAICLCALAFFAVPALAEDRCTGTLCDLFYGNQPAQPDASAAKEAPKPLMVPSGGVLGYFRGTSTQTAATGAAPTPSTRLVGVGGGGLAAMARGEAPERCTGTLCDFYYGGPPPEKPAPAAALAPAAQTTELVDAASGEEPAPPVRRYVRPEPPRCAATKDPWTCYR